MTGRRRVHRAVVALGAGCALAGCASGSTTVTDPPLCGSGDDDAGSGVILMAQSVPSASQVPCLRAALPLGWDFSSLDARNGSARFWLDSDRDGLQAVEVRLAATCDTRGATEVPTDREGMLRLERVTRLSPTYAGERYYLFDGGCLIVTFALDGASAGEALAVASQVVGVVPRAELAAQVREDSRGRLELDPSTGGAP